MATRYEIPLDLWTPVRDEILQILRDVARRKTTITYSSLAAKVTRFALSPESYALHELLGEIARAEDAAGRGMLSVLVVHKRDGMPGQGFFKLAAELGRKADDEMAILSNELKLVHRANAHTC
jgi:hypothetical protein